MSRIEMKMVIARQHVSLNAPEPVELAISLHLSPPARLRQQQQSRVTRQLFDQHRIVGRVQFERRSQLQSRVGAPLKDSIDLAHAALDNRAGALNRHARDPAAHLQRALLVGITNLRPRWREMLTQELPELNKGLLNRDRRRN